MLQNPNSPGLCPRPRWEDYGAPQTPSSLPPLPRTWTPALGPSGLASTGLVVWPITELATLDLDNENDIPYLHYIWTQAYVNLRKIYINLQNHREYPHESYIAGIYSHWATSSSLLLWVYLHSIFVVVSERRMCFEAECVMALQGHQGRWFWHQSQ